MPWYEYRPLPGRASRPIVQVNLWLGDFVVRLDAMVDAGADYSLIDVAYAEELGLIRGEAETGMSIGATGSEFR